MALTADTHFERYTIRLLLGAGGMGEVYLADDTQLGRLVALKLLSAEASRNQDQIHRFIQEAQAASQLNHPNILTIYEFGQIDGLHFIATEYIEGVTLREKIKNNQSKLSEILHIAIEISSALAAAHQAGIVHRDIKPENIMVRKDGYVKVLDFGIAKLITPQISIIESEAETIKDPEDETTSVFRTAPGTIIGTISYMSPEQTRGLEIDARTDIWSLGVVLYEMVTGKIPFDGLTASDVLAAIISTDPMPLNRHSSKTPLDLELIINKCLCKETNERYQRIDDLLIDLKKLRRKIDIGTPLETVAGNEEIKRIAILPFRNVTSDSSVNFYEFSLADAVITELARMRSLIVCPSSVVAKYLAQDKDPLEIGKELKVNAVLATSFLHTGQRMRVTTQLIDVINENILWGERIDTDVEDIFTVQDVITRRIVDGLQLKLSSGEGTDLARQATDNSAAYIEYLRGRDRMRRYIYQTASNDDIAEAIEHFKYSVTLDSDFALGFCALGSCYLQRVFKGLGDLSDIKNAKQALDKGLALAPNNVEALAYRSYLYFANGEKQLAQEIISRLRRKAANNSLVHFFSAVFYRQNGDYESALQSWEEMLRVDPTAKIIVQYNRSRIYMYQKRYNQALSELSQAAVIEPDHPIVKFFIALTVFRSGNPSKAAELLNELLTVHPRDLFRPYLAMCLSALGKHEEARQQITDGVKKVAATDSDVAYWLGSAYVMENQFDEALNWLEYSIELGNENRPWFESNPIWKPLHDNSHFKKLMNRIEAREHLFKNM